MAANKDFVISQGKTFSQVLRWESTPIIYKAIAAITKAAPVRITSTAHGVPAGWRVAVVSVRGMLQINAANDPPRDRDYHPATVVDVNTVELNDINSADFKAYTSGGYLQFNTPVDLTSFLARMTVRNKVGGTLLAAFTTENDGIILSNTYKTVTLSMSAVATAAITWKKGVYDLEMVSPTGVVTPLVSGAVTVIPEITT